jgi:hypothetical protein
MARCHDMLAARRRRFESRNRRPRSRFVTAERLLLAGVCVVYLMSMASDLLTIATSR